MADESGGLPDRNLWTRWFTPRRVWQFVRNIVELERSVEELKQDNRALHARATRLEIQVAEHDAQLRLLTGFVRDSLSNRLEAKIDKLAAELLANKNKN